MYSIPICLFSRFQSRTDKGGSTTAHCHVATLTRSNERTRMPPATGSLAEMCRSPLPPSICTSNRTSTKTTQLGNKNAEGQKEMGGGGWSRQITFDPKIVNGSLTGNMLWEVYGLWLFGPVCTKVMRLWKGPWIDSFFLLCVVRARAPRHSYHWSVTAGRGVTLWKHTGFHWSELLFPGLQATVPARRKKTMRGQPLDWSLPNRIANGCRCRTNLWRGLSCVITTPYPSSALHHLLEPPARSLMEDHTHKKKPLWNAPHFFSSSCEPPIRSCSYLFDVAAISERLLCPEKMERSTSMITFMLWIENKKAKRTDNVFTSNGHTDCTCYCYGSFSSFMAGRAKCYFSHEKACWGMSDIIGRPFCTHLYRVPLMWAPCIPPAPDPFDCSCFNGPIQW